ncbi:MAG: hypothetical protein EKK61_02760 [Rickettsiales bacterium]|nr:MAG: hypothetical protein EKK61_02760 [Rickettsiales bacterium]
MEIKDQLLIESFSNVRPRVVKDLIIESIDNNPVLATIEFPCLPLDIKTGNGRSYPTQVIAPASAESNRKISNKEKTLWCTAGGHPGEEVPEPTDSSHIVVYSWIEEGYLWSRAYVIDTSQGRDFLSLIKLCENGIATGIGFSVRGTGAVSNGVVTKYEYLGCDAVGIPSTGLQAKPIRISQPIVERVSESKEEKNDQKIIESTGVKPMSSLTTEFGNIKSLIKESIAKISKTKNLLEATSIVTRTEAKLEECKTLNLTEGLMSVHTLLEEWEDTKKSVEKSLRPVEECNTSVKENYESDETKELSESLKITTQALEESLLKNKNLKISHSNEIKKLQESLDQKNLELAKLASKNNIYKSSSETNSRNFEKLKESKSSEMSKIEEKLEKVLIERDSLIKENRELVDYSAAAKMAVTELAARYYDKD